MCLISGFCHLFSIPLNFNGNTFVLINGTALQFKVQRMMMTFCAVSFLEWELQLFVFIYFANELCEIYTAFPMGL